MLVDLTNKFFMINVSSTDYDDVVSKVIGGVEISQVICSKSVEDISISLDWLTHHMFSINVEVSIFDGGFKISMIVVFMFLMYFFLNQFQFVFIKSAVRNSIS